MTSTKTRAWQLSLLALSAALATPDAAAVFCSPAVRYYVYVGNTSTDAKCNADTIQDAIALVQCPGTTIAITPERAPYSSQHITIADQGFAVKGVSTSCDPGGVAEDVTPDDAPPAQIAVSGDGANPVFSISGNSHVSIANLVISGGVGASNSLAGGGGISFNSSGGALTLTNVTLQGNTGGYGGGVAIYGDGSLTLDGVSVKLNTAGSGGGVSAVSSFIGQVDMTIADDPALVTDISGNTASFGGGIFVDGNVHLSAVAAAEGRIIIHGNNALQNGGGIEVDGPAIADIGLPGASGIEHNSAEFGGGIEVGATNDGSGVLRVFSTDPDNPTEISDNTASSAGGGISILGGTTAAHGTACLFDTTLIINSAGQVGGAIDVEDGGHLFINASNAECDFPTVAVLGAVHCDPANNYCNMVELNGATTNMAMGAIQFTGAAQIDARRVRLFANTTPYVLFGQYATSQASVAFSQCLVTNNSTTGALVNLQGSTASFDGCTFADDTIGGSAVFAFDSGLTLTRSIVSEGNSLAVYDPGAATGLAAHYLILSGPKLQTDSTVTYTDPLFVDAPAGDFHLQAASPAIDYAPTGSETGSTDLDLMPREVDLPQVTNRFGARDLGPYEYPPPDVIFRNGFD